MKAPAIAAIGHVALRVEDLPGCQAFLTRFFGLREAESEGGHVYLTHGSTHHSMELIEAEKGALDHLGLVAADEAAIEEIVRRVDSLGCRVLSERPLDPVLEHGAVVEGPEGFIFEVYVGMPDGQPAYDATGVRPIRFGHYNLKSREPQLVADFLIEAFDFRVSDVFEPPSRIFLRCNADHHGIALAPADAPGIHHHAWEARGIGDLARLGDVLDENGEHLVWGPLRHGVGRNIAAYFLEPAGTIIELYTDMEEILDERGHRPGVWSIEDRRYYSFWAPLRPGPEFREAGLPLATWDEVGAGTTQTEDPR